MEDFLILKWYICSALLHIHELVLWSGLQNVGYLLMLIVMFYNGWFVISTLIGSTLGYFIFGQTFIKINIRNCQILRDTYCMLKCEESGEHLKHVITRCETKPTFILCLFRRIYQTKSSLMYFPIPFFLSVYPSR